MIDNLNYRDLITLPETKHSHGKSTILMVFTRKDGIFMGYVSFREGIDLKKQGAKT